MHTNRWRVSLACVVGCGLVSETASGGSTLAQDAGTKPSLPAPATAVASNTAMPPALRLGDRVVRSQQALQVVPELVIVPDQASYLEALSAWTPTRRFPVLIDDGSPSAAEQIARFARAFEPKRVLRWQKDGKPEAMPTPVGVVDEQALRDVVARAWGLEKGLSTNGLVVGLRERRTALLGVVLLNPRDEAWTAGVALAAHRGQPIFARDMRRGASESFNIAQADEIATSLERDCDAAGLAFRGLGDEIDAITLTANCPTKVFAGGGENYAFTDRIGRPGLGIELEDRWAWSGQIFGDGVRAAYVAMCSIFLVPRSAWMFDGYPDDGPWAQYDLTKAGEDLKAAGWTVEVLDKPNQGARDWRARAARPVDAGLLMVNTKGNADFFDLEPGQAKPADIPILDRPSILLFTHSWSALSPANREHIAGRWMERGVYFYVGSVHEPFLQAFLPGKNVMARAMAGGPMGAAVRHDRSKMWRVATFGDPLMVMSAGMRRSTDQVTLPGSEDVVASLREDLKAERFDRAFRTLLLAGRDNEIARLASALVRDKPTALSQDAVELAILPSFRELRFDDMLAAYRLLNAERAGRPELQDALWLAATQRLAKPDEALVQLLRSNVRTNNIGRDATTVASAIARLPNAASGGANTGGGSGGGAAARAYLQTLLANTSDPAAREALTKAIAETADALR